MDNKSREMKRMVSIVIPALNEEQAITRVIRAIPKDELRRTGYKVQLLVVDNGSDDRTAELARKAGAEVVFEPRRGYGQAYKAGFAYARGDIIATADADLTYPVEDIPRLVKILEEQNLDFITTNRYAYMERGALSFQHRVGNAILSLVTRLLFQMGVKDCQSGMWVFRKSILDKMVLKADSMAFSQELKIEACHFLRCRWRELPIQYRLRVGKAKLRTWKDGLGNLLYLMKKRIVR